MILLNIQTALSLASIIPLMVYASWFTNLLSSGGFRGGGQGALAHAPSKIPPTQEPNSYYLLIHASPRTKLKPPNFLFRLPPPKILDPQLLSIT